MWKTDRQTDRQTQRQRERETDRQTDRDSMHACARVRDEEWCPVTWPQFELNTSYVVRNFCSAKSLIHACMRLYHCTL